MKIVVMIHQQIIIQVQQIFILVIMEIVVMVLVVVEFEENHHIMQLKNDIDQVLMKEYLN